MIAMIRKAFSYCISINSSTNSTVIITSKIPNYCSMNQSRQIPVALLNTSIQAVHPFLVSFRLFAGQVEYSLNSTYKIDIASSNGRTANKISNSSSKVIPVDQHPNLLSILSIVRHGPDFSRNRFHLLRYDSRQLGNALYPNDLADATIELIRFSTKTKRSPGGIVHKQETH